MSNEELDKMVSRFLGWRLPKDFHPDAGISFDGRKDDEWNKDLNWPIGTNLFTADQAKAMILHIFGDENHLSAEFPKEIKVDANRCSFIKENKNRI